jgi:hypothetical protein
VKSEQRKRARLRMSGFATGPQVPLQNSVWLRLRKTQEKDPVTEIRNTRDRAPTSLNDVPKVCGCDRWLAKRPGRVSGLIQNGRAVTWRQPHYSQHITTNANFLSELVEQSKRCSRITMLAESLNSTDGRLNCGCQSLERHKYVRRHRRRQF